MFVAVSLLLATACLLPAAAKLLGHSKMRLSAAHFGIPWFRYRLIGAGELAAAAGVMIGLRWHPLGVAAAAGMVLLLLGAVITHRRAKDSGKEMAPALLVLVITIAYLAAALNGLERGSVNAVDPGMKGAPMVRRLDGVRRYGRAAPRAGW
jgi:uncharacterized membrane protein YhaH (DUF805 family)